MGPSGRDTTRRHATLEAKLGSLAGKGEAEKAKRPGGYRGENEKT